ncbi:hypothetical protein TNCV_620761 [Trichonephila clavipes]|nr:hypothetical protein TNCV_620761 [Trichonephila clavipes]
MMEAVWSAKRIARHLGRSNCVVRRFGTSGSERCHLHNDNAQDALDRPVVEKTTTSQLKLGKCQQSPFRPLMIDDLFGDRFSIMTSPPPPPRRTVTHFVGSLLLCSPPLLLLRRCNGVTSSTD